jgi:guanylate kinase
LNPTNGRKLKKTRKETTTAGIKKPGFLFIISAPSGAGKSTLCCAVMDRFSDLVYSISYTTRPPRSGEQNGVDYHFIVKDEFEHGIARGRWAEWAQVHDHYYGTSAEFLDRELSVGRDILLDIDTQGTRKILLRYPDAVTIFILPPSLEALKSRLQSRDTDSPEVIAIRMKNAREEIAQRDFYRHIITNDRLTVAVAELISIIEKYRS